MSTPSFRYPDCSLELTSPLLPKQEEPSGNNALKGHLETTTGDHTITAVTPKKYEPPIVHDGNIFSPEAAKKISSKVQRQAFTEAINHLKQSDDKRAASAVSDVFQTFDPYVEWKENCPELYNQAVNLVIDKARESLKSSQ